MTCGTGAQLTIMARSSVAEKDERSANCRGHVSSDEGSLVDSILLVTQDHKFLYKMTLSPNFHEFIGNRSGIRQ